jgi:hypothetical protein
MNSLWRLYADAVCNGADRGNGQNELAQSVIYATIGGRMLDYINDPHIDFAANAYKM